MKDFHNLDVPSHVIGQRILVTGISCSGKSTLARELSLGLNIPVVELDALNWEPNWVGLNKSNPKELIRRMQKVTLDDRWIVDGSYAKFSQQVFWPRVETIVWLDLPLHQLIWRLCKRSWQRWRSRELLWGTNYENFWSQLMVWRKSDSLLWWIITQYKHKRHDMLGYQMNTRWRHIRFIRLCTSDDVRVFCQYVLNHQR